MVLRIKSVKGYRNTFLALLGSVFLFRLWFMTSLPLSGDEAYHWEWSRHLAFGYYDHPGLTAYLIKLFSLIFGSNSVLAVRVPALLMLTGTSVVGYIFARFAARQRGGTDVSAERAGFLAGVMFMIVPVFALFSTYMSTDPSLIFFWCLSLYLFYRAVHVGGWTWWLMTGIALGLGAMSKFLIFFLPASFGVFLLVSPKDREWFLRPHGYAAVALAVLVFSPCLVWNARHGWATFLFNFVVRQDSSGIKPEYVLEFIGGQALALSPGVFICGLVVIGSFFKEWRLRGDRGALLLGLSVIVPFVYFLFVSFTRRMGPHWPAGGWTGLIVALACSWSRDFPAGGARKVRLARDVSIIIAVIMLVFVYAVVHIPQSCVVQLCRKFCPDREAEAVEASGERFGWEEFGIRVSETVEKMKEEYGSDVFVMTRQYGVSAAVAFYTPDQLDVHLWSRRRIHGENYRYWDDYPALKGMNALFVAKREKDITGSFNSLRTRFKKLDKPERVPIMKDGVEVRDFWMLRCYEFDGNKPDFGVIKDKTRLIDY